MQPDHSGRDFFNSMYGGFTMVTRDDKQLAGDRKASCHGAKPEAKHKVSPLRQSMIRDMGFQGLSGVSPFFSLLLVYEHQISKTANMRIH